MLKLIYIFGLFLMVNTSCYDCCLKFHTHLQEHLAGSLQSVCDKCSRVLNLVFSRNSILVVSYHLKKYGRYKFWAQWIKIVAFACKLYQNIYIFSVHKQFDLIKCYWLSEVGPDGKKYTGSGSGRVDLATLGSHHLSSSHTFSRPLSHSVNKRYVLFTYLLGNILELILNGSRLSFE